MNLDYNFSLQLKNALSQAQINSLNILSMSSTDLQDYLTNESMENPLVDYFPSEDIGSMPITYQNQETFYCRSRSDDYAEKPSNPIPASESSIEDLLNSQIKWETLTTGNKLIAKFCILSLDSNGYLKMLPEEISALTNQPVDAVIKTLDLLKSMEPKGIFSYDLQECLHAQIQDLPDKKNLSILIRNHLDDIANNKISTISRSMNISTVQVRKLIYSLQKLNPRPLNGYGADPVPYIHPDIILTFQNGQWNISLNDHFVENVSINAFYEHMIATTSDPSLSDYFEQKLKRARSIIYAINQRRQTLLFIAEALIQKQASFFLGKDSLKPMTLEEIADLESLHKSTISRAIKSKYLLCPRGCFAIRDLFTTGLCCTTETENSSVSRNAVMEQLSSFIKRENKLHPYSDDQITKLFKKEGIIISRRTVAKYRSVLNIPNASQRKEIT